MAELLADRREETADWTTGRIVAIRDLFHATLARCRARLPSKVYSKEIIELISFSPIARSNFWWIRNRQAADGFRVSPGTGKARYFERRKAGTRSNLQTPGFVEGPYRMMGRRHLPVLMAHRDDRSISTCSGNVSMSSTDRWDMSEMVEFFRHVVRTCRYHTHVAKGVI